MSKEPDVRSNAHDGPPKKWKWHKRALYLFLFLVVVGVVHSTFSRLYDSWDVGSNSWFSRFTGEGWQFQRGAAIVDHPNQFGDQYSSVRYLSQGWTPAASMWFYTADQGSDLIPYDFFMALEATGTGKLFRSDDNLYSYGNLPQKATRSNPDALPVGFVKDTYLGKDYFGFSCAACHTGQVNYKGVGIRIDGGPTGSDMDTFQRDLTKAMQATLENDNIRAQFVKRVLDRGNNYSSADAVLNDLKTYTQRLAMYSFVNASPKPYGYYRLDAFGRIYNRVLEQIITQAQLKTAMEQMVRDGNLTQAQLDAILIQKDNNVLTGERRDHLVERLSRVLPATAQRALREMIFNSPDAPVSYPFLWDIPQHDYVQWNGIAANAGLGPVGRNSGEVIGVFATLDWEEKHGFSLTSFLTGQGFHSTHVDFKSSVDVHNLRLLEHQLESLQSPVWPNDILPQIDEARSRRGEILFGKYCADCHDRISRTDPARRVVAHITKLQDVRTDPKMAVNAVNYQGWSGILRNQYTSSGGGQVLIDERAPVAALLGKATIDVVLTPSPNKGYVHRGLDWFDDLLTAFLSNDIKPSIKRGTYDPDTTAQPYASLFSYKARSLNGIWATAPYLHNGSVPTLYDLLLPKKGPQDPPEGEYRPDKFMVGSREFDPVKVGLRSSGYEGFHFDVEDKGNSNAGHEYGTKVLSKEERLDLVEYLKSL
ncbi:MAG TPA: di-heme-cytochrome C peroxidase [Candidatus Saccharimonadales bacterium]|jgi:hypothetical protein|nr:di-heme-cytochrome C peroxidase [Candidatus Saccharimonadales bacterium]